MIRIELTQSESQLLHKILDFHLSELAVETAAGGIDQVSELMQAEEAVVHKVLAQLSEQGIETLAEELLGEYSG